MEQKEKIVKVAFWKNTSTGIMRTHHKGLSEEQIKMLREINVGDTLVIFPDNTPLNEKSPTHSLLKAKHKDRYLQPKE